MYSMDKAKVTTLCFCIFCVSGQLSTKSIPRRTGIGPDEWFYWLVVVLVGHCPSGSAPDDNSWALFLFVELL